MHVAEIQQSLRRRWYVVVVGLLTASVAGAYLYQSLPPTYERSAVAVLIPGEATVPDGGNRYTYLSGLNQARDVLVRAIGSSDVREPIITANPGTNFAVDGDATTNAPFVVVTVTATDAAAAGDTLGAVLDMLPVTLGRLQDEVAVPAEARITALEVKIDSEATASNKERFRAAGAALAGGIGLTVVLAALVDGIARARQRRAKALKRPAADGTGAGARERGGPTPVGGSRPRW